MPCTVNGPIASGEVNRYRFQARKGQQLVIATLARQYSEGPGADKGGELGTFSRGEMEGGLEDVLLRLKPGEISEPVRSGGGFHLLRVDERIASGHKPLDEVKEDIREALYNEALETRFRTAVEGTIGRDRTDVLWSRLPHQEFNNFGARTRTLVLHLNKDGFPLITRSDEGYRTYVLALNEVPEEFKEYNWFKPTADALIFGVQTLNEVPEEFKPFVEEWKAKQEHQTKNE